ncbi:hypothetical protein COE50_28600 [Bacillus anthracis]|nr:hypothetical protein COE50_28600 [Bacillus anthracis]
MIASRLKEARKNKKWTQEELAKKVGTKKATISNYENEYSTPSNHMLMNLADALDVTSDYLIGRTDSPQTHVITFSPILPVGDPYLKWDNYTQDSGVEKVHIRAAAFEINKDAFEEGSTIPVFVDENNNVNIQIYKYNDYLNDEDTKQLNAMIQGFLFNKKFIKGQKIE